MEVLIATVAKGWHSCTEAAATLGRREKQKLATAVRLHQKPANKILLRLHYALFLEAMNMSNRLLRKIFNGFCQALIMSPRR